MVLIDEVFEFFNCHLLYDAGNIYDIRKAKETKKNVIIWMKNSLGYWGNKQFIAIVYEQSYTLRVKTILSAKARIILTVVAYIL